MKQHETIVELITQVAAKSGWRQYTIYWQSLQTLNDAHFLLVKLPESKILLILSALEHGTFVGQTMVIRQGDRDWHVVIAPLSVENAKRLRQVFSWTAPQVVGSRTSFGCGDRIGLATPGHIRCLRNYRITPVLAQQSIREMTRTQRSPQQVMDDVSWAVFQEGYQEGFGSDADHLKTPEDIDNTITAGFIGFTLDPSDHINNRADEMEQDELDAVFNDLFATLSEAESFVARYTGELVVRGKGQRLTLRMTPQEIKQLAVKYLPAIRHTILSYRLIKSRLKEQPFDFEMSVDETETPTTIPAHYLVANELRLANVTLTSLAPRFAGEFQKAIDYIGDIAEFRRQLIDHVALSQHFGSYKISVHSGSDKYSIFPIVGEVTDGFFHEKTAGTSYLEALRIMSRRAPILFREIARFARAQFEKDRFSYHVTTDLNKVPDPDALADQDLERFLDENDARQVLHLTFGSTLTEKDDRGRYLFREKILKILHDHEEEHYQVLQELFTAHLEAFGIKLKS